MTTTILLESPESGSAAGETAGRLRLVHQDRSVINAYGFSVDTAGVEDALNRHPALVGGDHSLGAVAQTQLGENARHVRFHRGGYDKELLGDLDVAGSTRLAMRW